MNELQRAAALRLAEDLAMMDRWADSDLLRALAAEPVDFVGLLREAEEIVHEKQVWKRFIDGTPLANDVPVWMATFAQYKLLTAPPRRVPLTAREIELIDGMIEVQLHHAAQCDHILNRPMAVKQKGWDMERVELLRKIRAHGIGGSDE